MEKERNGKKEMELKGEGGGAVVIGVDIIRTVVI